MPSKKQTKKYVVSDDWSDIMSEKELNNYLSKGVFTEGSGVYELTKVGTITGGKQVIKK